MISETHNIDCMDFMRGLPDGFFDLVIADPPYGIDLGNMNMGLGTSKKCAKAKNRAWTAKDWDKSTPDQVFFNELKRVSKNQIIWGGNYFDLPPCKNYAIWDKEIPEGLSFADCEMAWTSFDNAPKMFRYSVYLDKTSRQHPTQKPVALYKWLLTNYAKPGHKIFDPMMGSQSSRIAAWDMGFDYYGCELDADYYRDGEARFKAHTAKPVLFAPEQMYNFEQAKLF